MELRLLFLISLVSAVFGTSPRDVRSRCQCIGYVKCMHPRHFQKIQVMPKMSSCNKSEIIVTVKSSPVCMDPDAPEGKTIINCWERNEQTTKKVKQCVKKNWNQLKKKCRRKRKKKQS